MSGANANGPGGAPFKSIAAGAAVANGGPRDNGSCRSNHTIVAVTSAGVAAGAVQLQGSMDNVSWFNIGAPLPCAAASSVFQQSTGTTPARYIRGNVSTLVTGGTVDVWVGSA
jgi:hypothetical protein